MKKLFMGLLAVGAMAVMTACGGKGEDAIPTTTPTETEAPNYYYECGGKVTLGDYKALSYTETNTEVTEKDVQDAIADLLKQNPNYEKDESRDGSAVASGDKLNIDYTGYIDDKAFENGSDKDFVLEIGSKSFIDGFEDSLIGKTVGETTDIFVTFPTEYKNNPDLAGKDAKFTVTINYVCKELDKLTDSYVASYTKDEYKTVDAYVTYLKEQLKEGKESAAEDNMWSELMENIIKASTFDQIDQADIDHYYNESVDYYEYYATMYGTDLETLISYVTDYENLDAFYADQKKTAEEQVKQCMILEEIVAKEGITVSDEKYASATKEYMDQAGYTELAKFEEAYGKDYITYCIKNDMALEVMRDNAKKLPASEEKEEEQEDAKAE